MLPDLLNQRKVRALRAQESQIEGLVQTIGLPTFSAAFSVERFRLAVHRGVAVVVRQAGVLVARA